MNKWRLDELAYGIPSDGPYQTNPPYIKDIILSIRIDREGQVCRIRREEEIDVHDYQILTREIIPTLKPLEEIIWENVFCQGGNRDHVPMCLCFMLYCAVHSERFNISYYMAKQMEWVTKQARLILPYGMLLTRLFKFIMNKYPRLYNEFYVLYNRVMNPLAAQLEQKPRRDHGTRRGRHSTSSSSAFYQPSSSHLNDHDDDGNDEGTSFKPTFPQTLNPLLENILDVPPRALNPQPLQSLPYLDITVSLSPITPLENLSSPPSPSPPPPQPPIMGHLLYYNYHDYHGSTYICCFHNCNLHLNLRDEINMFAHLEYLLTTAFITHFPPQP
ncbi:hypothetical protein Tco_1433725 [Tanacetum coccineum]